MSATRRASHGFVVRLPDGLAVSRRVHGAGNQQLTVNRFLRHYRATSTSLRSIADEVTEQMKVAMKAKDTARLATIRLIRSSFANAAIDLKVPQLSDDQAVAVLRKMAKMRADSIQMYTDGGALDRAEAEKAELAIIESWLPTMADEETTRTWVREAIQAVESDNVGKVMGALMKAHKAEVDGTLAQKLVKEEVAKAKSA